jgi:hypothetical protein
MRARRLTITVVLVAIISAQFFIIVFLVGNWHVPTSIVSPEEHLSIKTFVDTPETTATPTMRIPSTTVQHKKRQQPEAIEPRGSLPNSWAEYYPLRNLVNAFVSAKIDWHFLVPGLIDTKANDQLKLYKLIKKEATIIDTLLDARDKTSIGPVGNPDYNPDYQFCNTFNDKCVIHRNKKECHADGFCSWCESTNYCTERYTAVKPDGLGKGKFLSLCPDHIRDKQLSPPQPLIRNSTTHSRLFRFTTNDKGKRYIESREPFNQYDNLLPVQHNENLSPRICKNMVYGTTYFVKMKWEGMYWHLIKSHLTALVRGKLNLGMVNPESIHFIMLEENFDPVNFRWFSMLTKNCVRALAEVPEDTCFENIVYKDLFDPTENVAVWSEHVLKKLNLQKLPEKSTAKKKPILGLISRHNKRIILNEPELVRVATELGYDVRVLIFERMTIEEQLLSSRECDVLMGIHGSGLLNEIFMRKGTVSVQVVPFGLPGRGIEIAYGKLAEKMGLTYKQLNVKNSTHAVLHWHFMEDIFPNAFVGDQELERPNGKQFSKKMVLERGSASIPDITMSRVLMVQQDSIIPVDEFVKILKEFV